MACKQIEGTGIIVPDGAVAFSSESDCLGACRDTACGHLYSWVGESLDVINNSGARCTFQPHAFVAAPASAPNNSSVSLSYTLTKTLQQSNQYVQESDAPDTISEALELTQSAKTVSYTGFNTLYDPTKVPWFAWPANRWRVFFHMFGPITESIQYGGVASKYSHALDKSVDSADANGLQFSATDGEVDLVVYGLSGQGDCYSHEVYVPSGVFFGDIDNRVLRYSAAVSVTW